jgi:hypothetical protein
MSKERRGGKPKPAEPPTAVSFRIPESKADLVPEIVAAWGDKTREAAGVDLSASALSANQWFASVVDREAKAYGLAPPAQRPTPKKKGG